MRVMKHIPKEESILLGVSGGKDSLFALYALSNLGYNVEALFIDLGIPSYSIHCRRHVESMLKEWNVKLHIVELKSYTSVKIEELKPPCRYCGIAKRYLLNKFAYENGFDWIATGHNMDDILSFFFLNVAGGNIEGIAKLSPVLKGDKQLRMVGRIKPLYYMEEKDIVKLTKSLDIAPCPYVCPLKLSTQIKAKSALEKLDKSLKIKRPLLAFIKKLKKKCAFDPPKLKPCKICGYPTPQEVCSFCKYFILPQK